MSTQTKIINSDGTGPKLNGTQLFFRTRTYYTIDNNGKVTDSTIYTYYTPYANGLVPGTGASGWQPGSETGAGFQAGGYTPAAVSKDKGKTFQFYNYEQIDADAGRIPPGKKVGDPVLSPQAMASLNSPNGVLNQAINNSVINTANKKQRGLAGQLSKKLQNAPDPGPRPVPPGATSPGAPDPTPVPIADSIPGAVDQQTVNYGTWKYPTKIGENKQDYILFEMYEYSGRGDLSTFDPKKGLSRMTFNTNILGRVFLPLQPTISDINTVDWQNDTINPLQLLGAQLSLKGMQSGYTEADFAKLKTMFADNPAVQSYLQQWFAGKAVGTNIFSRFSGAVVNPNLELLFNGPQLRPFNFSFRLSPRDKDEAKQVKGIIRFFKQGMSVRRTQGDLFLKAPNIFKITYINGQNSKEHTSLNKIKFCSLTQCGVDYTPDGSYATFYDKESTMTQYGLTLQFNELEPIYDTDYEDLTDKSTIGY